MPEDRFEIREPIGLDIFLIDDSGTLISSYYAMRWNNGNPRIDDNLALIEGDVITVRGIHKIERREYRIVDTPYDEQCLLPVSMKLTPLY